MIRTKQELADKFDARIEEKKDVELKEKKQLESSKALKVVAPLVPWKKGEAFEQYKQHLILYNSVNAKVSDPRARFLAILSMLKTEGHTEEAKNVQETLKGKVDDKNIIDQVIDCLSKMNERSMPEKAKQCFSKLLDDKREGDEEVTKVISRFRNNVADWEGVSKSSLDGLFKVNLLLRMVNVNNQVESNIRTKVDFTKEDHNTIYNDVEMALKDLAGEINICKTYKVQDVSRFRGRSGSYSRERRGSFA